MKQLLINISQKTRRLNLSHFGGKNVLKSMAFVNATRSPHYDFFLPTLPTENLLLITE